MRWTAFLGWTLIAFAAASLATAMYNQYRAYANLLGDPGESRRAVFRRGPFAGRELFTERGWRYWRTSFQLAGLTAVLLVVGGLLLSRP